MSFANERIKQFQTQRDALIERLRETTKYQIKYYNKKHQFKNYIVEQFVMFSIKNLKQKRSNKKLTHKFVNFFRIKKKLKRKRIV